MTTSRPLLGRVPEEDIAMDHGIYLLESRYLTSCRLREVQPSPSILSSFLKVKHQKLRHELCCLEIILDQMMYSDFPPLIDAIYATRLSGIDAVDVRQVASVVLLIREYILSLFHAVSEKLRVVDLVDCSFWKDICQDICRRGLTCQILNLRFCPIRKLNMTGKFVQLHTLNLDFSISLTSFYEACFSCMPNLMRLSMCETKVSNMWMTTAALSKLPCLMELRFQNCSCCFDTGPCQVSDRGVISSVNEKVHSNLGHLDNCNSLSYMVTETSPLQNALHFAEEASSNLHFDDDPFANIEFLHSSSEDSSDESDLDFSTIHLGNDNTIDTVQDFPFVWDEERYIGTTEHPSSLSNSVRESLRLLEEVIYSSSEITSDISESLDYGYANSLNTHESHAEIFSQLNQRDRSSNSMCTNDELCSTSMLNSSDLRGTSDFSQERHILQHPSPICFEKHYREFLICSLPRLKVLDNFPIKKTEREKAKVIYKEYYEYSPYNRIHNDNVASILYKREVGTSTLSKKFFRLKQPSIRESCHSFARSLSSAKVCSAPWPCSKPVSKLRNDSSEKMKSFRPRQFEYHPSNPCLMVFGTLDGELIVINHESMKLIGYLPSLGSMHSILGLCWLKKHPSKLIAGADNGSMQLYDISKMSSTIIDQWCSTNASIHTFDEFEQLTSVHINSSDEYFLASGFSKHVALYDIGSGKRLQIFEELHQEHINVVKFAHHSPSIFATASFDHEVKVWDLRQRPVHPCYSSSSSRGNVTVCFSPDDHYLLASAIDNEVRQLLAVDGRLHTTFNIAPIGSSRNYTRSYYMNGRDYIISGSCEENVVRICCAQTGRRLRDVSLDMDRGSRKSMFVQSLRGDPFRDFHMSVLSAYLRPRTRSEIIKVNLLSAADYIEDSHVRPRHERHGMGG